MDVPTGFINPQAMPKVLHNRSSPLIMPQHCQPNITWIPQYTNGQTIMMPACQMSANPYCAQPMYLNMPDYYVPNNYVSYQPHYMTSSNRAIIIPQSNQNQRGKKIENENANKHKMATRYESADSGIAESCMTSQITWSSDESNLETDSIESPKSISRLSDVISGLSVTSESKDSEESPEKFWSVSDDDIYWHSSRQHPPMTSLLFAIAKQIDYYLSDDYLVKDKYLLRQIRCKKDGYVSIKLITSFKKVKKLTKDWSVVRSAIVRKSNTIVVSSEGLRIKRKTMLSESLRKPRLLTSVLVIRLPQEYNSVDKVTSLFRKFGEISLVRLLRADKEVPTDLKNYATQVQDIGTSLCAIIDFESAEDALTSVRVLKYYQRQIDDDVTENDVTENRVSPNHDTSTEHLVATKYNDILFDLPQLGNTRLALLGPRVRRTLYRQDRPEPQPTIQRTKAPALDTIHKIPAHHSYGTPPASWYTSRGSEKNTRDVTTVYSNSLPKNFETSRPWSLRHSVTSLNKNLCHVIRQPKGPDSTNGFKLKRSI